MAEIPKELLIQEEYKVWKKNTPFLYDTIATYETEWPSLTVSWFPEKTLEDNKNYTRQRILMGTLTSNNEQNSLIIGQIRFPKDSFELGEKFYNEETESYGGFGQGGSVGKFEILQKINHDGEVNRARHMPQNPDIIATKTNSADVLIFDRTKHSSIPLLDGKCNPQMRLKGHDTEGYGLSWNPFKEGRLVSGSDDGKICIWDVSQEQSDSLKPLRTLTNHTEIVEDVAWHLRSQDFFASASDDRTVILWDERQSAPSATIKGHQSEVNSVAFSPHSEFFLLSGSKDRHVGLWDLRKPQERLHMLEGHEDAVFCVQWSPLNESVVASAGADRRVMVWDLSKVGKEQSPEDSADGPPELVFVHGGHNANVSDFCWNTNEKWTIASVADDNVLQVWTVAKDIYQEETAVRDSDLE